MRSIAIPCACGKKVRIILHEGTIFVASHDEAKPRPKIKRNGGDGPDPLPCKECGRVFFRAASLGIHRRQAHGVKGANAKAKKGRK